MLRFFKFIKLLLIFLYELHLACFQVLALVLTPRLNLKPGIIRMDVNFKKNFQLVLLASIINMTPGTLTLDISADKKTLYVHALNIDDSEAIINVIRNSFEKNIMEIWD